MCFQFFKKTTGFHLFLQNLVCMCVSFRGLGMDVCEAGGYQAKSLKVRLVTQAKSIQQEVV